MINSVGTRYSLLAMLLKLVKRAPVATLGTPKVRCRRCRRVVLFPFGHFQLQDLLRVLGVEGHPLGGVLMNPLINERKQVHIEAAPPVSRLCKNSLH